MDASKEKYLPVILIVLAVGVFLNWQFSISPILKQMKTIDILKNEGLKKKALIRKIDLQGRQMQEYSPQFFESKGLASLIDDLGKMATQAGLVLISATPMDTEAKGSYTKLTIQLEARGGYHALGQFISLIESSSKFIKVSNLHVQQPQTSREMGQGLKISLSLSVFSELQEAAAK